MRYIDGVTAWAELRLTNLALEGNNSRIRGPTRVIRMREERYHLDVSLS